MKKILIQQGHVSPRQPGFESGTGTTGEIETVSSIGLSLFNLLKKDSRFQPTLCPGKVPTGWTGDVVLALHCDGSGNRKATGYSLGWPCREYGPKTAKLRYALVKAYESLPNHPPHHSDNYTTNMSRYYAWSRTTADAKILIEHGFLTNPKERAWLVKNRKEIAGAWYKALLDYFDLKPILKPIKDTKKPIEVEPYSPFLRNLFKKIRGMPWIPNPDRRD